MIDAKDINKMVAFSKRGLNLVEQELRTTRELWLKEDYISLAYVYNYLIEAKTLIEELKTYPFMNAELPTELQDSANDVITCMNEMHDVARRCGLLFDDPWDKIAEVEDDAIH